MFLPIYPCNVAMWLLVISAFCKNKKSKIFAYLGEFTFYLGVVGGIVGILFNEIYSSNPNLLDYGVLKGLLSHSTMLFGCIYLLVGGYIKIRVKNVVSVFLGLLLLLVDGGIIIGIHRLANLEPPNSMYLLNSPFAGLPWINTATIGIASLMLVFTITTIVEQLTLKREERWYMQLRNYKKEKKINE